MDFYQEKLIVYVRSLNFIEFQSVLFESNTLEICAYRQLDITPIPITLSVAKGISKYSG